MPGRGNIRIPDAYIIDQIRRREQDRADRRPYAPGPRVPDMSYYPESNRPEEMDDKKNDRGPDGTIIVDYTVRSGQAARELLDWN